MATKINPLMLLNKTTSKVMVGDFWDELLLRAKTERGKKPELSPLWIRDYCEIIADITRSIVYIQGCSQVGKSYEFP
jgi:hypothetical protein